jgi:hypothetical protein
MDDFSNRVANMADEDVDNNKNMFANLAESKTATNELATEGQ